MQIIKNKILSWEPLEIKFVPEKRRRGWEKEIFAWLQGWEKDRLTIAGKLESSQMPLEYYVAEVASDGTVVTHIEWLCEESLVIFENYIRHKGTNIKKLIIGEVSDKKLQIESIGLNIEFIKIPPKNICTENQKSIIVPAFEISKYPITIGQFSKFVNDTNYKTTNENRGYYLTYFENDLLIGMGKREKKSNSATCLSFLDALEYCRWAGFRLPSDQEWLSASVLDWSKEYKNRNIGYTELQKYISHPNALKRISPEWINEFDQKNNTSIVRYGPGYFLYRGWKRKNLRRIHPSDYTDLILQFRVSKNNRS